MSKTPAMFRPFVRFAEFNGRSNRAELWLFILFMYLVMGVFAGLMYVSSLKAGHFDVDTFLPNYVRFAPLLSLFNLAVLIPYLAVGVRRLHDTGRTGWWFLFPVAVSILAYIVFFAVKGSEVMTLAMNMGEQMSEQAADGPAMMNPATVFKLEWPIIQLMIPWVIIPSMAGQLLLWFFWALPGNPGDNRFGAPPAAG